MSIYQITPFLCGIPKNEPLPTLYFMYGHHFLIEEFRQHFEASNLNATIGILPGWTWHMNEHQKPNIRPTFKFSDAMAQGPVIEPATKFADQASALDCTFGFVFQLTPELTALMAKKRESYRVPMALDIQTYINENGVKRTTVVKALVHWDPFSTADGLNDNILAGALGETEQQKWKQGLYFLHRLGVSRVGLDAIQRRLAGQRVDPEPLFWTETGIPIEPLWKDDPYQRLRQEQIRQEKACQEKARQERARREQIRQEQVRQEESFREKARREKSRQEQARRAQGQSQSLDEPQRSGSDVQRVQGQPVQRTHGQSLNKPERSGSSVQRDQGQPVRRTHDQSLDKSDRLGASVESAQGQIVRRSPVLSSPRLPTHIPGSSPFQQTDPILSRHIPPTPPMTSSPRPMVTAPDAQRIEVIKAKQEKNRDAHIQRGGRFEVPLEPESSGSSVQRAQGQPAQPGQQRTPEQSAAIKAMQSRVELDAQKAGMNVHQFLEKLAHKAGITVPQFVERLRQKTIAEQAVRHGTPTQRIQGRVAYSRPIVQANEGIHNTPDVTNKRKADGEIENAKDLKRVRRENSHPVAQTNLDQDRDVPRRLVLEAQKAGMTTSQFVDVLARKAGTAVPHYVEKVAQKAGIPLRQFVQQVKQQEQAAQAATQRRLELNVQRAGMTLPQFVDKLKQNAQKDGKNLSSFVEKVAQHSIAKSD